MFPLSILSQRVWLPQSRLGREPQGVAFAPDGTTAYVTNIKDDTVSVLNTTTRTQTTTIAVGRSPQSIAVTPGWTTGVCAEL